MTIDDIMIRLKKEYLDSFSYKIVELKKKIDSQEKEAVIDLFHQIKGSGKTYGFAEISSIAERAEQQIPKANPWIKEAKNDLSAMEKVHQELITQAA